MQLMLSLDLCPQEAVSGWVSHLRADHPTVLFRSASAFVPSEVQCSKEAKGKGKVPIDNAWGTEALLKALGEAAQKKGDEPLAVAVVGFTNVFYTFGDALFTRSCIFLGR